MATFFMLLSLPSPKLTAASTWATLINSALTTVDSHTHVSGEGQRITSAAIDVDGDFSFNTYSVTDVQKINFFNTIGVIDNSVFVVAGDLNFKDGNSNTISLTAGGSLDYSGFGGIDGDYSSSTASLIYVDSTKTYTFYNSLAATSNILLKDLTNTTLSGTTLSPGSLTTATASLQGISATSTVTASGDVAFTGNTSGRGIIPVGAVIGLASNLVGVSLPTSFLELNGQTINDATSPMDGVTLPNVSNSLFLMGSSTAGTTGGAATYTLTEANVASHSHVIDHSHANTFALGGGVTTASSTHTHNIAHTHQYAVRDSSPNHDYSLTSADSSTTSITSSNTDLYSFPSTGYSSAAGTTNLARFIANNSLYTTGVLSPPSGSDGATAASATPSATQVMAITGAVTDYSGNSGSAGSGTAISLLPNYITTKYVIRYK